MERKRVKDKGSNDWGLLQKKGRSGELVWYARIVRVDSGGKKRQYLARADNKSHARRLRDDLTRKFADRGEDSIQGSKLTFRRFAEIYKQARLFPAEFHINNGNKTKVSGLKSVGPVLHYLSVLVDHFGRFSIALISHSDIEAFRASRLRIPSKRGPRSVADVNRTLALMRTMMRFAIQNGWISHSPFERGRPLISLADEVRRERVMTGDEELLFMDACMNARLVGYERNGKPVTACIKRGRELLKAIVITALDTAMRKGEILSLRWRDIDLGRGVITISANNSKTSRARLTGITPRLADELQGIWNVSLKNPDSLVFGISDFKKSFAAVCNECGIQNLKFHDLRHTAITRMINAGIPPMEIMKLSGHTQWSTFARYVNPTEETITRIAETLAYYNENHATARVRRLLD